MCRANSVRNIGVGLATRTLKTSRTCTPNLVRKIGGRPVIRVVKETVRRIGEGPVIRMDKHRRCAWQTQIEQSAVVQSLARSDDGNVQKNLSSKNRRWPSHSHSRSRRCVEQTMCENRRWPSYSHVDTSTTSTPNRLDKSAAVQSFAWSKILCRESVRVQSLV